MHVCSRCDPLKNIPKRLGAVSLHSSVRTDYFRRLCSPRSCAGREGGEERARALVAAGAPQPAAAAATETGPRSHKLYRASAVAPSIISMAERTRCPAWPSPSPDELCQQGFGRARQLRASLASWNSIWTNASLHPSWCVSSSSITKRRRWLVTRKFSSGPWEVVRTAREAAAGAAECEGRTYYKDELEASSGR